MEIRYLLILAFLINLLFTTISLAYKCGDNGTVCCNYEIYVKSNKYGINSTLISNGKIISLGVTDFFTDSNEARARAAITAKKCLDDSINASHRPESCKVDSGGGYGKIKLYNINNLKLTALNTICDTARMLNKGNKIEDIEIYATNKSHDDCNIWDDKDDIYYIITKGLGTTCLEGISAGEFVTGKNYYTGWYYESASQIRNRIKNWCKAKFMKSKYKIDHFEIQKVTGKVRALFDCL